MMMMMIKNKQTKNEKNEKKMHSRRTISMQFVVLLSPDCIGNEGMERNDKLKKNMLMNLLINLRKIKELSNATQWGNSVKCVSWVAYEAREFRVALIRNFFCLKVATWSLYCIRMFRSNACNTCSACASLSRIHCWHMLWNLAILFGCFDETVRSHECFTLVIAEKTDVFPAM